MMNRLYSLAFEQKSFLLITAAFIFTLPVFFSQPIHALHTHWTTPDDIEFGYLLLVVSLFFAVKNLDISQPLQPNYYYVMILLGTALALSMALILEIKTLILLSLLLYWPLTVGSIMGHRYALSMLLPVAILFMAMPAWYLLISVLQGLTVKVVGFMVSSMGITALIEGNYFTIPTGVIHVAGGCSGLKYFITAITLALISSALSKRSLQETLLSVAIGASLAVIANWIRVFILMLVGYYSGIDHPLMADHDNLGWVVFAISMVPWFYCERYLLDNDIKPEDQATERMESITRVTRPMIYASSLCLAIVILSSFSTQLLHLRNHGEQKNYALPKEIANWKTLPVISRSWYPAYVGADQSLHTTFLKDTTFAHVTILNYVEQNQDKEMANVSNTIFDSENWKTLSDQALTDQAFPFPVRLAVGVERHNTYYAVIYWFNHGAYTANSILGSKLAQLWSSLTGHHSAQLVAIAITCSQNCNNPEATIQTVKPLATTIRQWLAE